VKGEQRLALTRHLHCRRPHDARLVILMRLQILLQHLKITPENFNRCLFLHVLPPMSQLIAPGSESSGDGMPNVCRILTRQRCMDAISSL